MCWSSFVLMFEWKCLGHAVRNLRVFPNSENSSWIGWLLFYWMRANQNISFCLAKTQHFNKWLQNYKNAIVWPHVDLVTMSSCSYFINYSSNFHNSFLIHFNSKNCGIFCIKLMKMSSIWLWFLINFPLAGF